MTDTVIFQYNELFEALNGLLSEHFEQAEAKALATIFTEAEFDGLITHGLKRFPRFMDEISRGWVEPKALPKIIFSSNNWAVIDGQHGPGPLNALFAVKTAIKKAKENSVALIGVKNTNHWLRPGYYATLATQQNCVLISWTNTLPNMQAHTDAISIGKPNLGNNPIVIGIPNTDTPLIFDTALSQFSYGKIQEYVEAKEELPVLGGYNHIGEPTQDPKIVFEQLSASAIGWWKGSGFSIMLDLLSALLSGGQSVKEVSRREGEQDVSQVFICIDVQQLWGDSYEQRITELVTQLNIDGVRWPGKSLATKRANNNKNGVHIPADVWQAVLDSV